MDLQSVWIMMGETVYVRSCSNCGQAYDSTCEASAEAARDAHERACKN